VLEIQLVHVKVTLHLFVLGSRENYLLHLLGVRVLSVRVDKIIQLYDCLIPYSLLMTGYPPISCKARPMCNILSHVKSFVH